MKVREEGDAAGRMCGIIDDLAIFAAEEAAKRIVNIRDAAPCDEMKAAVGICSAFYLYMSLLEVALDAGIPHDFAMQYIDNTAEQARKAVRERANA